jgi:asparagine synthase (glutamine-hydrolysing)
MCGLLYTNKHNINIKQFINALESMSHRGPDSMNHLIINDNIKLGHTRLKVIDIDNRSNQPFWSQNKRYVMLYNGEIYNYKELAKEYNITTKTSSDTEILLELYSILGYQMLKKLNGMFSIVIYDKKNNDLFVARDRLGIKPLYYSIINNEIIISSEIAAILKLLDTIKFDDFGIRQYKKLRMTVKGYTLYKDIKTFPPGHFWLNGRLTKYWDLEIQSSLPPDDGELKWLIEDAVHLRKRSDVPMGSYLSGGLDSTILTYILQPDHTWSVGFDELNEFKWSDLANSKINTKHYKTIVDKDTFLETAKWMIKKRNEPLSVPNEVLIYLMTKNVKKKNTVILSGEGADELFWGYDRIFKWAQKADYLNITDFDEKYCYGTHSDDEVLDFALKNIPGKKVIDKIAYFFQTYHLQGLLRRVDNSTMLCSVEARVPFVDHRLVELLAGTPFSWRMGTTFKDPLKRIFKSIIPTQIIKRKKVGFPVPLEKIFPVEVECKSHMDHWLDFNLSVLQA